MKKIFLALVLSTASVFSISAQTDNKSTVNTIITEKTKAEKVETDKPAAQTETVKPDEKAPAANLPETVKETEKPQTPSAEKQTVQVTEEKPAAAIEPAKKPATVETVKTETVKAETAKVEVVTTETVETTIVETPKPAASAETVKMPEQPILQVKKPSLGGLSTGNATIDGYIEEFSALYNVDPLLIYAQMSQESSFRARATSMKGASGYMQLMPATAARFGVTNIYNPKQNIKAGVKYMRWLLDKFGGDMRLALAGYNAGEGAVMKYGNKIPPYRETQNYVLKIMTHYELISTQDSTLAQTEANK